VPGLGQNDVTVVNPRTDRVVGRFGLVNEHSDDPAPDLFGLSPRGDYMFASLRGASPSYGYEAFGSTPGVGVIEVRRGGRSGHSTAWRASAACEARRTRTPSGCATCVVDSRR
jgi:hypothetical protein